MSNEKITLNIGLNNNARVSKLHSNMSAARNVADIAARMLENHTYSSYGVGFAISEYNGDVEPTVVVTLQGFTYEPDKFSELVRVMCSVFSQECIAAVYWGDEMLEFNYGMEPCYRFDREFFIESADCERFESVERPEL